MTVIAFMTWIIAGVLVLIQGNITRMQYAMCWVSLMCFLVANVIR